MKLSNIRKKIFASLYAIAIWIVGLIFEDRIKLFFSKIEIDMKVDIQYALITGGFLLLVLLGLIVYWTLRDRYNALQARLTDNNAMILFFQAILLENVNAGRLNNLTPETIQRLKITPKLFEYLGYSDIEIQAIFPDYKAK